MEPAHPETGEAISLDSGYAFAGIFPDLAREADRALTKYRAESLQYGRPFGLPGLREWISEHMREDGANVPPDDVLVVNGAKNGLDLLCRLFTEEGDCVVVTAPTYFTAIPIFRSFGLTFLEATQDGEGLEVDALARALVERKRQNLSMPKFIYDISDFHNPTGITMSRRRREALVALSASLEIPIIEDSPYRKLRFEGEPEPSLKSLDENELVFALGTFSKLLAPGLRVGWVAGKRSFLRRMARLKSDGGSCPLTQRIVLEFCTEGRLRTHVERARATYGAHRDVMVAALRRELPDAAFTVPQGGYYLWLTFPERVSTEILAERAYRAGVSVIAGGAFFAGASAQAQGPNAPARFLRLAYSGAAPDQIEEGVRRLATAYRSME